MSDHIIGPQCHGRPYVDPDRCAPECDDQLPVISQVGRGIKGDSYRIRIKDPDSVTATYLEGLRYDEASKQEMLDWMSENINGGHLSWHCNLRPWTDPKTFTMTWIYRRPGRPEWSGTTPAIPYIPSGGEPDPGDLIGSGVGNLFIRNGNDGEWVEKLLFPPGTEAEDYNAPEPMEPWSVNLTVGPGEDIDTATLDHLAEMLGWSRNTLLQVIEGVDGAMSGANNVKEYIDETIEPILINIQKIDRSINDIVSKIYGGGTVNPDGTITWPNDDKVALGNMNVYAGSNQENWIKTRYAGENDYRVE